MSKVKKGDTVLVIAGKFKGKIAVLTKIDGEHVYVEGVNMVKRATKGKGFVDKQLPLHISNVMFYAQDLKAPSRLGVTHKEGKKVRILKKNGKNAD